VTTEPILGWRLWHVRLHEGDYRLESFTWHHVSWPAGRRLDASCAVHGDDAPVAGHECGIYAFRTRELAEDLLRRYTGVRQRYGPVPEEPPPPRLGRPVALGRVSLWGRVLEREHGFRAQYAYPYDLFVIGGDDAIAAGLRRRYAVDVTLAA
jgi:hypothetical protein